MKDWRLLLGAFGAYRFLSRSGGGDTTDTVAIYPADDGSGWTFEASTDDGTTAQWTLTNTETGDVITFAGNRVTRDVPNGQYAVTVELGSDTVETTVIIGGVTA